MPDVEAGGRDEFLRRIADQLPFGEAEKQDILGELASHLADSTARFQADGLSGNTAERAAIERLGPPERLGHDLADARRSPRRLLAAAGAGTWAAVGGVVYGYLLSVLVLVGVTMAAYLVVGSLHLTGGAGLGGLDLTTITLIGLGIGANIAGQRLTTTMAARAGYRIQRARPAIALIGGLVVLGYALVGWRGSLSWPEVGLLLSLPAWFMIGAWRAGTAGFPSVRWRLRVGALETAIVLGAMVLGLGPPPNISGSGGFEPAGMDRIALPTPDAVIAATQPDGLYGGGGSTNGGITRIWLAVPNPAALHGWSDFRVEAWRAVRLSGTDSNLGLAVDPGATAPFATGAVSFGANPDPFDPSVVYGSIPDGMLQLSGSIAIDRSPSVTLAWIALTGVAPDGKRYFLEGPSYRTTAFNGTALDWLTAVISGR